MTFLCFVLITQTADVTIQPGAAREPESAGEAPARNPFHRYIEQRSASDAIIDASESVSGVYTASVTSSSILTPTPAIEISTRVLRIVPPILHDLKAIVIMHDESRLAMFGDQIVSVSDALEGFTVLSISFDKVVLTDGLDEIEETLGSPIVASTTDQP